MRTWLMLGAFAITSASTIVCAQDSAAPEETATSPNSAAARVEARRAFAAGIEAIEAGLYGEGVEHMERSLELFPRIGTAYNLAVARRGIGDFVGARVALRAILADEYGEARGQTRARALELLSEAEAEIATIHVVVDGGAPIRITVDGQQAGTLEEAGELDWDVNPGTRVVRVEAPNRQSAEHTVRPVAGSRSEITVHLVPVIDLRPGRLELLSTDPEARVEVVGYGDGIGRLLTELPAGEYTVRVTGEHGAAESRVAVPAGRRLRLELSPAPPTGDDAWIWIVVGTLAAAALAAGSWVGWELYEPAPMASPVWPTVSVP